MHTASQVLAAGADFVLLGPKHTQLRSVKPVVAVCAVRTGAGKTPTTRYVARCLRTKGYRVVTLRHPMPYGDLRRQAVQRFARYDDLAAQQCTIEEREEFEPILEDGGIVFAGVDYERIVRAAEAEADIILWDGGNNDLPFLVPDLHIVIADPHRAGHELAYHPGEANVRAADICIINKVDSAPPDQVALVRRNLAGLNPRATSSPWKMVRR
jgi:predicted GTPase